MGSNTRAYIQSLIPKPEASHSATDSLPGSDTDLLDVVLKEGLGHKMTAHPVMDQVRADQDTLLSAPAQLEPEPTAEDISDPGQKEEEPPKWFHALNNEQQRLRQEQHQFAAQQAQERQQYLQALQQIQQKSVPEPKEPDISQFYDEQGYVDVGKMYKHLRQEIQQSQAQAVMPVQAEIAAERFGRAAAELSKELPDFENYFPKGSLTNYYQHLVQKGYSPAYLASIPWHQEFRNLYDAKEAPKIRQELKEAKEKLAALESKKEVKKAEQTRNLRAVPSATQQSPTTSTRQMTFDHLPRRRSFEAFGQEMKRQLFGR
jgi:hypothetical protein